MGQTGQEERGEDKARSFFQEEVAFGTSPFINHDGIREARRSMVSRISLGESD
jgi:hypothetical protein